MSIELIGGIISLILALVGGGVGWSQVRKHGEAKREIEVLRDQIETLEQALRIRAAANPTLEQLRVSKEPDPRSAA